MPGCHKTGVVDGAGYFGLYLRRQELDRLHSGQSRLDIRLPLAREGSYRTIGPFPIQGLSQDKRRASVMTIPRPQFANPSYAVGGVKGRL